MVKPAEDLMVHPPTLLYGVTVAKSASSFVRGQLSWLQQRGWRVVFVSTPDDDAKNTAEREGVEFEPLRMERSPTPLADLVALARWVRTIRRYKPSAVNVSTPKAGLLGGVAAWILRVPRRLYVVRGLRAEGARGVTGAILLAMEWISMHVATEVIFVSQSLATEARRRHLAPRRRSWIIGSGSSNGVDAVAITEKVQGVDRDCSRRDLGLDRTHFVVGFVGRITRDKGFDTLVTAARDKNLDPRVRFVLVGESEEEGWDSEIAALGDRVRAVGWTDDVWSYLPVFDALALPTRREGFPNVVLEAAAAGVPAITTRATGAIDSVVDGVTGMLVDVGDACGLTSRINELATSPELVKRLGNRCEVARGQRLPTGTYLERTSGDSRG